MFTRLQLGTVAAAWWASLSEAGTRRGNILLFIGLPALFAILVLAFGLRSDSLTAVLTGTTFLAGILVQLLFRLSDWANASSEALDAHRLGEALIDSAEISRHQRRLRMLQRSYTEVTWALLITVVLVVTLAVLGTGNDTPRSVVATSAVAGLGSHLLLVLLSAVTASFTVTRSDLRRAAG